MINKGFSSPTTVDKEPFLFFTWNFQSVFSWNQNLNKMNRAAAISNEHFIVTNGTDEHLEEYFKFGNETLTIADNFDELCKEDIYQIMCACRKEEYAQILQGTENTQITAWWDKAADIIPLNCGKGNAVNAVLNYYGLSKDEAIARSEERRVGKECRL